MERRQNTTQMQFDSDFIVVGSGFGGSVSALRLAEKGHSVIVLEQGKRFEDRDFPKTNWDLRKYLWAPLFKCFGIQKLTLFKHVFILSGAGVGGGSLVYANTLLQPGDDFFNADSWKGLRDWKTELLPCYERARKMLGVTINPRLTHVDRLIEDCARDMGKSDTFGPTQVGVLFSDRPGERLPDPYFGGEGPERKSCIYCGGCMVGCRHNAKNTLVKNYLYFAEKRGVRIQPETRVTMIRPILDPASDPAKQSALAFVSGKKPEIIGYEVHTERSTSLLFKNKRVYRTRKVVLSGGVLGTVQLLLNCKYVFRTLPDISSRLGLDIRTNSEALIGITSRTLEGARDKDQPALPGVYYSDGVAISSSFYPNEHTHIEPVRYAKGSSFMRLLAVPMVDDGSKITRPLKLILAILKSPFDVFKLTFNRFWAESTVILLVMQTLDNRLKFKLGRSILTLFRKRMVTDTMPGVPLVPGYIAVGHQVARWIAARANAIPQSAINEVLLGVPTTAHILGGCAIGASPDRGVIDAQHQVYGYPGLYVCDGSAIPANLGVNPSLTITAMTERAMGMME